MKSTASSFAFGAALAAAALLAPGCRTIHRGEKPSEPGPATVVQADGVAPKPVVLDAKDVGKPGTYTEYVIADENADRSYPVVADGLTGQTGRHVPAPAPVPDPAPAAAPVVAPVAPAAPGAASVYVVQEGDFFGRIAQSHGVSQKALRDANPDLKNPDRLFVGQKLNVPPRGTGLGAAAPKKAGAKKASKKKAATLPPKAGYTVYVVQEGDILGRIANRHKTTVKAIQEANGIADPTKLRAGTAIYVPSAAAPAPAPAPEEPVAPPPPPAPADPAPAGDDFLGTFGV
jgi:LysM repeat protein